MTLEEYTYEVSAVMNHQRSYRPLSDDEMGHLTWARGQGYSPEMVAYSIMSHRVWDEWELPQIIGPEDDA